MVAAKNLVAVDDLRPAQWLISGIPSFTHDVTSLLPADFSAYARVFHPAYNGTETVSWTHIARTNNKIVHPQMQFTRLLGHASRFAAGYRETQQDVFDAAPQVGELPAVSAEALARTLARHTRAHDCCWFAVWNGWGQLDLAQEFPAFELPGRAYYLGRGPITAITQFTDTVSTGNLPCSLWWPDDHAWCVATDIDLDSTYVGGSGACIAELLANPGLEAAQVNLRSGIAADSDTLNLVESD
jgi:hypothetical protein